MDIRTALSILEQERKRKFTDISAEEKADCAVLKADEKFQDFCALRSDILLREVFSLDEDLVAHVGALVYFGMRLGYQTARQESQNANKYGHCTR